MLRRFSAAMLTAGLFFAAPAAAQQFSDSYEFLHAVRQADGATVTDMLTRPGPSIVNTRDATSGDGALHIVVKRSDRTYLTFLLQNDANPDLRDRDGNTPLMLATSQNWIDGVRVLVNYQADVDLANNRGETPLIRAVQLRNVQMVRELLEAGADPDKADLLAGMSARDYAQRDSRSPTIQRMLDEAPKKETSGISGPSLR
ncbi:ankyrin repeat domain-containing protein [Stakelama tenebrarum]|nr:ankyrin repeat domain-containing protein [Sphingosinithalassobacter tenebrarum]